jgi:hypothetical protein
MLVLGGEKVVPVLKFNNRVIGTQKLINRRKWASWRDRKKAVIIN